MNEIDENKQYIYTITQKQKQKPRCAFPSELATYHRISNQPRINMKIRMFSSDNKHKSVRRILFLFDIKYQSLCTDKLDIPNPAQNSSSPFCHADNSRACDEFRLISIRS